MMFWHANRLKAIFTQKRSAIFAFKQMDNIRAFGSTEGSPRSFNFLNFDRGPIEISRDSDAKVRSVYRNVKSDEFSDKSIEERDCSSDEYEDGFFSSAIKPIRSGWSKAPVDKYLDVGLDALDSAVTVFDQGKVSSKDVIKRDFLSKLTTLQRNYEAQKTEYENSLRNLEHSEKTLSLYMDRDKDQAKADCAGFAKDVLDTCVQLLDMYSRFNLVKIEQERELYRTQCLAISEFVKKLRQDLSIVFHPSDKTSVGSDISKILPFAGDLENDPITKSKILARIALSQIKVKEALLVLDKEKKSDLIYTFKSLSAPLQEEISNILKDRKVKGGKLFTGNEAVREKRLLIKVDEIFTKIEEVLLTMKLMSFDEPVVQERSSFSVANPAIDHILGLGGANLAGLSEPKRQEILLLKRDYEELKNAFNRAVEKADLTQRSFSAFGCTSVRNVVQEDGLECIERAELFLKSCASCIDDYLTKIHLMSPSDLHLMEHNCTKIIENAENAMATVFLVLQIFKEKQQGILKQRNTCPLSFSHKTDDLINQIAQKKAAVISKVASLRLKKIKAFYKMAIKNHLKDGRKHNSERARVFSFIQEKQGEIDTLLEGRALPGKELTKRMKSLLKNIKDFERRLFSPTLSCFFRNSRF